MKHIALLVWGCGLIGAALGIARGDDANSVSAFERDPGGWTNLIEGPAPLDRFTRVPIPPQGKLDPRSQWVIDVKTGWLVCEGNHGHEWLRYDQQLGDAIFHVEWRFTPVLGKQGYNSGIFARNSADGQIWHQAQIGGGSGGFLFGDTPVQGQLQRINHTSKVKSRVKPPGEWNTIELICKGREIALWVNGAIVDRIEKCEVLKGYVGLEAEGWRIEFRNVLLKSLT